MTVFVIPPVVGSPVLTLSVHARTGIRRPAAAWTPFERNPPMRLTVPTLNKMEDRGLAFLAGVVYVYSSLPDEKVDAALAVDYDALEWESEPVAVRLESPKRGLLEGAPSPLRVPVHGRHGASLLFRAEEVHAHHRRADSTDDSFPPGDGRRFPGACRARSFLKRPPVDARSRPAPR